MAVGNGAVQWLVGITGCGKSSFAKELIRKLEGKKSVIIFSTKNNFGRKIITDYKEAKQKALKASETLIIFDEMDSYLRPEKSGADKEFIQIQTKAREMNNLFIPITHNLDYIGNWALLNSDAMRVWKTGDMSMEPFYRRFYNKPHLISALKKIPNLKTYNNKPGESLFIPLR